MASGVNTQSGGGVQDFCNLHRRNPKYLYIDNVVGGSEGS